MSHVEESWITAEQSGRFQSLPSMRAAHAQLIKARQNNGSLSPEFLDRVATFVAYGKATGAVLDTHNARKGAQSLLDYWDNILDKAGHKTIDPTLDEFDPLLAPELDDDDCPYRGLDAFREGNQQFFFGRQRLVSALLQHLQTNRLLALVGPSGSGKSSVVAAGVVPRLKEGAIDGSDQWHYYPPLVPGSNPLENLVRAILPAGVRAETWIAQQVESLKTDATHLHLLVTEEGGNGKGPAAAPGTAVLVIDQFEELFTLCRHEDTRQAFIDNLVYLIQAAGPRHTVILSMRSDFEMRVTQLPSFHAYFEQALVPVTALNAGELRDAIEKPANLIGLKFEEGVIDALLQDILGEPAALPLLQFTLLKLWEKRERNRVTWEAYQELGGGRLALANSADEFYDALIPEEQMTARRILLRMVRPGEGLEVTSNRVRRAMLYQSREARDRVDRVLDKLVEARLVRLTEGATPDDAQVEVAHEALVRNWPRLVEWLEDERETMRRRLRLTIAAEQWQALGRDAGALLRGAALEAALRYDDLSQLESEFVAASEAAAWQTQREKEAARRRELEQAQALAETERLRAEENAQSAKKLRQRARILTIVGFIAIAAAAWALINGTIALNNAQIAAANEERANVSAAEAATRQKEAEESAEMAATSEAVAVESANLAATKEAEARASAAEAAANEAEARANANLAATNEAEARASAAEANSRELAAIARNNLDSDPELSLLLALEAVNVTLAEDQPTTAEAEDALYRVLQASQLQLTLSGHTDRINDIAFSADGKRLATAGADMQVKLWDAGTGQELLTLDENHTGAVNDVVFSRDGTRLATAGDDGFIFIWDVETGASVRSFRATDDSVLALAFGPDGERLADVGDDLVERVWKINESELSNRQFFGHSHRINDVVFSPDGQELATAGDDGLVIVYNLVSGAVARSFPAGVDASGEPVGINALALGADGQYLLTANSDGTASLWEYGSREGVLVRTLYGHALAAQGVAFSPDGSQLATASADGTARIWERDTGRALYTLSGHKGGISAIAFSPNGQRIVTAGQDGTVRIWHAEPILEPLILADHTKPVRSIAFNPDGAMIATASSDATIWLWEAGSGESLRTFSDHSGEGNATLVNEIVFSHEGTRLATAGQDGEARVWNVMTADEMPLLTLPHDGPVNGVAFSPDDGRLATASDDGFARIWDLDSGRLLQGINHGSAVNSVAFSPDGDLLATGGDDGTVVIWDAVSEEVLYTLEEHELPVSDVAFDPTGTLLATASEDKTIKVWDFEREEVLLTLSGHTGSVLGVAFSPDGERLASASDDKTARLWDASTGRALQTLLGHASTVYSVAFSPDGNHLATASFDTTAQINELNIEVLFERAKTQVDHWLSAGECRRYLRGRPCLPNSSPSSPTATATPPAP